MNNSLKNNLTIWDIEMLAEKDKQDKIMYYYSIESMLSINTPSAYLLDKNNEKMDIIEKFVFDIANFHLNQKNRDIMADNINIEFWFKTSGSYNKTIHTDGDDESIRLKKITKPPLCSILVYLNDNDNPTLLTNINEESYKFKTFDGVNKNICIVFPKKLRNIVFDGSYFHSEINLFSLDWNDISKERNVLVIDLWENYKPINLSLYLSEKYKESTYNINDEFIKIHKNKSKIQNILVDETIINEQFFCDILYKNDITQFGKLNEYIKPEVITDGLYLLESNNTNNKGLSLNKFNFKLNKLRNWNEHIHIKSNVVEAEHINYIIEKYKEHTNVETVLEPELLNYVLSYIAGKICNELKHIYNLGKSYNIDIVKIFMSNEITTSVVNTIVCSVFLTDALISHKELKNDIEIKAGTIIFQNDFYTTNINNTMLEFLINVDTLDQ